MEKISWEPVKDRHCQGRCELGDLWIRLDREGKVSGIYTRGRRNSFRRKGNL